MTSILLRNARVFNGRDADCAEGQWLRIADGRIQELSSTPLKAPGAEVIDVAGRTVMPGLIDAHVHVFGSDFNVRRVETLGPAYRTAHAVRMLGHALDCGFTTVRDVGGADHGLAVAAEEGLVPLPRLVRSGKALSQTGGHCDFRGRYDDTPTRKTGFRLGALGRICDGIDEVRRASREEIKAGADFIKIMANGGVASPTDPIHFMGFSREEIRAIVEEAAGAGTYVSAHLYTDEAIRRAVECGVHSLEHCNLIEAETAGLAAKAGAVAVPTLVTYDKLASEGASLGFPATSVAKIDNVRLKGLESLTIMEKAGLTMAYGTDLLGEMHRHQSEEFVIRGRVLKPQAIIASATHIAAKLCRMEGRIGTLAPGAFADLIAVDGNPLADLALLTGQGRHMPLIMRSGKIVRRKAMN